MALEVDKIPSIEAIAQKLSVAITDPLLWNGHPIELGVSIGIAVYPDTATEADALMNLADTAMYKVKHSGKNAWSFAPAKEEDAKGGSST